MPATLLTYAETSPGIVVFSLQGSSTSLEFGNFVDAVEAQVEHRAGEIRKMVFDLSATDPVVNSVGRILDAAVQWRKELDPETIDVEITMPREVYEDLQQTDRLPDAEGVKVTVEGVDIVLVDSAYLEPQRNSRPRQEDVSRISYTGKVRELTAGSITVSLFTNEGEIVGELTPDQFPDGLAPTVGQVFLYQTAVTGRGRTEVVIELVEERNLDADELIDIWERVRAEIPLDEPSRSEEP